MQLDGHFRDFAVDHILTEGFESNCVAEEFSTFQQQQRFCTSIVRPAVAREDACAGGLDAEESACPADFLSATVGAPAPPSYTDGVIKGLFWV